MKTKTFIFISLIAAILAALFFSCETPIGLGEKLDISGPVVGFVLPVARKAVLENFDIEGVVSDASGVERLLLKAERDNDPYPKQWRYDNGSWEVSQDYGSSWFSLSGAQWTGSEKNAAWKIHIDMSIGGNHAPEGEYMFIVQAWDIAGYSDDNSFKTRVFILDNNPPTVEILDPYIYKNYKDVNKEVVDALENNAALIALDAILDTEDDERFKPSNIGKFLTRAFQLQWIINDNFDVWSIDLRFYDAKDTGIEIDENSETALPDGHIFRYWKNETLPPDAPQPEKNVSPNGSLPVPDLYGSTFSETLHTDSGGYYELKKRVTEKTTIKVVALTYDTAKNSNLPTDFDTDLPAGTLKEIVLGYFIFWPKADEPWITLSDGMYDPSYFTSQVSNISQLKDLLDDQCYMIYPGRTISADAFHAHGLKEVVYSLYSFNAANGITSPTAYPDYDKNTITNIERNGNFSQTFSWSFAPPPRTGYYVLKARPYSIDDKAGEERVALFRVQDITFPNFPIEPRPEAGVPLFNHINTSDDSITIKGYVSDATDIASLNMVWINPESRNYAAMSQLQYFRDQSYPGWKQAENLGNPGSGAVSVAGGYTGEEPSSQNNPWAAAAQVTDPDITYPYDINFRNRLWNLTVTNKGSLDTPGTGAALQAELESEGLTKPVIESLMGRVIFSYEVKVPLVQLNILGGPGHDQALKSQTFMLRAINPDGKATIITYAPQGDTLAPTIVIDNVVLSNRVNPLKPNTYAVLQKFADGNTITINGFWNEDSAAKLPIADYFTPNFHVTINGLTPGGLTLTKGPFTITDEVTNEEVTWDGKWQVVVTLGSGTIPADKLRDTLVIAADVKDIGGNISETGCSWLIASDNLRLMRISSEKADNTYKAGEEIEIFIEFSKPVRLTNTDSAPVLILDSDTGTTARAVYGRADGTNQSLGSSTRQYFLYTVQPGHNTGNDYLSVKDIDAGGITLENANYPFRWHRGTSGGEGYEEIRLTNTGAWQSGTTKNVDNNTGYYTRTIPTDKEYPNTNGDYQYTLAANKHIKIDTVAPTITGITAITAAGDYTTGADIYINATFSKPVKVGADTPRLQLNVTGSTPPVLTGDTVRINGNEVTFSYNVKLNDTTSGQSLVVSGINALANITDIAGTPLASFGGNRTLTGVFIDATPAPVPTLKVLSANNANSIVTNTVGGTVKTGSVSATAENLENLYQTDLWLAVQPNTTAGEHKYSKVEYSVNGVNWIEIGNNTPLKLTQTGSYSIIARQTDKAGNVSSSTANLQFNWDPGALLTRISSSYASGTYTHNSNPKLIPIQLTFRKSVIISGTPSITINARRGGNNITLNSTAGTYTTLTFTYDVQNGDSMPSNTQGADGYYLDITALNISATDAQSVNVTNLITQPAGAGLLDNRSIRIETGNLSDPTPTFTEDSSYGGGQGIQADGSYWTTLQLQFNHDISKGSGNITIEQIRGSGETAYRLPAVLTEAQYNRFRNAAGLTTINTYYTKGTNGYLYDGTKNPIVSMSDTSVKYVLGYDIDTSLAANKPTANGTGGTAIQQFAEAFRVAERITINVNSAAVERSGSTLKVRLTGSNAPQVPGATYAVSYPAGLVTDALGNSSAARTNVNIELGGVAKPFVRIKRSQDTIGARNTANLATTPTLVATQPTTATVRFDSRTPNSTILYTANTATYVASNRNWNKDDGPDPAALAGNTTITPNGGITRPTTTSNTYSSPGTPGTPLTIGNSSHGGFKWWVLARARTGAGTTPSPYAYSDDSYEIAYRTAITYRLRGTGNNGVQIQTTTTGQQRLVDGDQIWIRGGDSIGSSTIPGFPFTWEDDFTALAGKRAGIRLMTKVAATTQTAGGTGADNTINNLNNSQWEFQTWDINATAYIGFFLGRDAGMNGANKPTVGTTGGTTVEYTPSVPNEAWQYGPRWFTAQRGGWTSLRTQYRVKPGEHRWIDVGEEITGTEYINFPTGFNGRPDAMTPSPNANTVNW